MDDPASFRGLPVPSKRWSRLWHMGRATTDMAVGIGVRGMIELARARGENPSRVRMSPEATRRVTDRLARMRGAVMKMGQLMSMDGTDVFTPEVAEVMATLRDRAEPMPIGQLAQVLDAELGADWNKRFQRFEFTPIAAASIGQVHRAETRDGRRLALKIQFPGVRESIDSDVDNMRFLSRTLGMMPKNMDVGPMLDETRRQLHREADYLAEADAMEAYRALIGEDPDFLVPEVHRDLSTSRVLAMTFADGISVDRLRDTSYTRAERDRVASLLTRLMLRELFEFAMVQTDPNFSNFLYDATTGRVALLDFGAAQPVAPPVVEGFRLLGRAALADDPAGLREASIALGYIAADEPPERIDALVGLIRLSSEMLRVEGPYDFGTSNLSERVFNHGRNLYLEDNFSRPPEPATLFLHRKFAGTFMLCRRLRARVDLAGMMRELLA
ncbi:putative unusual protein kinase [Thioflavicoccus mobilis 8321]|uniref:Putative unusual protein kinase n=1 Tax=Thioflavicoccus mobilis 8321 TaxID=765912 RepID=L0GTT3_9GAMM|nr:AarF/ABC1/UbiB kinase family protein [Thioflavicoccus mobilis]AGA89222.1 putative unusual protein kinase [Thioflavicoccus mobilis 8321]